MVERWPSWAPNSEYRALDRLGFILPLVPHFGFPVLFRMLNGRVHIPIINRAEPDIGGEGEGKKKWPLIVFSHGLGCSRSTYSRVCYDLASYGFVVAAVEHRDGTACASFCEDESGRGDKLNWIPHRKVSRDGSDEYEVRNSQVHQRVREVSRALDLMLSMEKEGVPNNLLGVKNDVLFASIAKAMDTERPVIAGHSFGGATTILSLIKDRRFAQGIALDAWMFPLRDEVIRGEIEQPLMFISTDSFRSVDNGAKISELCDDSSKGEKRFHYIKGSVHQNHIDVPFVINSGYVRKAIGMHSETCAETVIDINNKMMVQFVWKNLNQLSDSEVDQDIEKHKDLVLNLFS